MRAPKWPVKAVGAIRALFETLQDIDIYVEDEGSEAFYTELFRRIAPSDVRLYRVLVATGRANVVTAAAAHDFARRRALFLIDGDFEWVRGEPPPDVPGLLRLDCYCVENLLICEHATARILMESEACTLTTANSVLDFDGWVASLEPMRELFVSWAALNKLEPTLPTVSRGIGAFLTGSSPRIDVAKVDAARAEAEAVIMKHADGQALLDSIRARVSGMRRPLDIVSGKDFVLPALHFHLRSKTKEKPRRDSLRFRLALHVATERFTELQAAVLRASRGVNLHS